jgi:mannose-1-phosphate guanylyltransferase
MKQRALWAIVLAGGEGSRLAETSRRMYGTCLPKQFSSFGRKRTFLQATVDRLQLLIAPERTVVVVSRQHESLARQQLADYPAMEIVPQPRNLGTGPGVLLPLVHVLRRAASADVALVPSDHDFRTSHPLLEALQRAQRAARHHRGMVLLGAAAEAPASDLGWIVPRRRALPGSAVSSIREFVEKPSPAVAASLFAQGALWNTMLSVTPASALWALAKQQLPRQVALLERYAHALDTTAAAQLLDETYRELPSADFSRDLVAAARTLWVTPMLGAGWSDCGTPERLEAAFAGELNLAKAPLRNASPDQAAVSAS